MIAYRKNIMTNGLTLLVHEDRSTPMVSVNVLYGVGARDEEPTRTGFAHLFEHLMFGGTRRVPDYDAVVSGVGGESNAFTNNDITNFYLTVPARKLETALWLESDRMRELDFSQRRLEVQQSVVTEEYNYRYMNQPYGDKWLLLRPLCYKVHPYRWCTIGADIRHVQEATLADVETFFYRYYRPANAILSVAGDVRTDEVVRLVEKWFGDIEAGQRAVHLLPQEPEQTAARTLEVEREVPSDALYVGYVTGGRCDAAFRATDLVSDVLGSGHSSRLYNGLVKGRELFTDIDVYVTGEQDGGLFVVDGQLKEGVGHEEALAAVEAELQRIATEHVGPQELEKVQNRYETTFVFSQYKALDRAMALCYYEWMGHLEWINEEPQLYRKVSREEVRTAAERLFRPEHRSALFYKRK